ncbi:MAG: hypothetical protein F6K24_30450 [Okeania sp. SIO2D1]|nr:hypothetical protein [Okeania sp. SIO2D1]
MNIEEKYCISAHEEHIRELVFHPNGHIFASCGDDHAIKLWYVKTGEKFELLTPIILEALDISGN